MKYTIDNPQELLKEITNYLKPKQKEKQENGEVFTPMWIIFEMLDALDIAYDKEYGKSIFTEKNLKWFEPASGIGNFFIGVYLRLMDGLILHIPNYESRKKYIIENMLYMSEINIANVEICKKIFNPNNLYKMNIYIGDTLEMKLLDEWPEIINGFDIIIGNPPYNKGSIGCTRKNASHKTLGKYEAIWPKFINKSFELLRFSGFLVFIIPLSWLKNTHKLHNMILEKNICYLRLWDNSKSLEAINGKIPISLFILQNVVNTNNKTNIISEIKSKKLLSSSTAYLNPKYSIPLAFHNIFNKLIEFIESQNLQLEFKTKIITSSGNKIKLPCEYTQNDLWAVDTYTIKEGIMVKKANGLHQDANKKKIIISNKSSFIGAFIDDGRLGLTGSWKSYILGDNLEVILKLLSFKICNIIGHYTKYKQDFLEPDVFMFIPDIRKLGLIDITEDVFYSLIGLSQQELSQIELYGV